MEQTHIGRTGDEQQPSFNLIRESVQLGDEVLRGLGQMVVGFFAMELLYVFKTLRDSKNNLPQPFSRFINPLAKKCMRLSPLSD
ncbi:hypothetical protein KC726_05025 [Candidatus Woesebacteria bacterium]|nr:hypothetical protein [Candidatus Woesebacteria bacterium]